MSDWLPQCSAWPEFARAEVEPVTDGMSEAQVFRVTAAARSPRYLKTATGPAANALRDEVVRTRWLAEHGIRVPRIARVADDGDRVCVLMEAVRGGPADAIPMPAMQLAAVLARGVTALHALPAAACPFDETLPVRLRRAAADVARGTVRAEDFAPRNRHITPEQLLARLEGMRPSEDNVVVHGDATLANIFVTADGGISFIDCGRAGRGDRYIDLAVLACDIEDHYGADAAGEFKRAYTSAPWDEAKACYFADLYELF